MLAGQIAFYVLAIAAIGSALGVITFRNAVYSALSLIANLFCLALFFLMLNAIFLATVQVLVYTGAIMVLFLFVVTMLSPDTASLQTQDRMRWQRIAAAGMGIILGVGIGYALISQAAISPDAIARGSDDLATAITSNGNTEAFGLALFHGYLFPFEVTSIVLVAAILGAVVLGRRTSSNVREED
jgi:NADH-quinone oxidoreductase subunit J